ncbi:unnamed protein product [Acanthoscelides obtectus]|uniref:Uncharacterized protein n=1 Tax=Acanthoscelides obtectus TaxID=200917 RepID=A0A9P0PSP4_ACAOB|nr:unnamed protein product [Acanthoscelides obtectus]CAK1663875.1 hypothetical protein AOBTE_LOCUS23912 [Acanthoscelides obtectus]
MAGFRVTGLFPFDPNAVDYSKCISNRRKEIRELEVVRTIANPVNSADYKSTLKVLEHHMDPPLLDQFSRLRDIGDSSTNQLFHIWSLCKDCSNTQRGN